MRTGTYHIKEFVYNVGLVSRGFIKVQVIGESDKCYRVKNPLTGKEKWVRKHNLRLDHNPDNIRLPYKN